MPWLDNRAPTGPDVVDLHSVDVDAAHFVALRGQTRSRDGADVTQTEDGDPHGAPHEIGS